MYAFPLQQFGSNDSYVVCIILSRLRLVLEFEIMFPNRARSDHAFGHKEDCNDCSHLKSIVPVRKTRMMSGNVSMFKCSPASASYRGSGVDISDALPLRFQHSLTRCRTRAGSDSQACLSSNHTFFTSFEVAEKGEQFLLTVAQSWYNRDMSHGMRPSSDLPQLLKRSVERTYSVRGMFEVSLKHAICACSDWSTVKESCMLWPGGSPKPSRDVLLSVPSAL
jgi:hypothetical protein